MSHVESCWSGDACGDSWYGGVRLLVSGGGTNIGWSVLGEPIPYGVRLARSV